MAKQTPEGKVKKKLIDFLKSLGGDCFYYMPVQNGMGQTGIPDVMAIIKGVPFAFECKATPKQHPTVLQAYALDRIHKARGVAWVVDSETVEYVVQHIERFVSMAKTMVLSDDDWIEDLCKGEPALYRWKDKLKPLEFDNGDLR
jgi:hypothetical protein